MNLVAVVVSSSYTPVIYIVAALLGGGLVPVLYQAYKNFKRGPIEDGAIIGKTVRDEMGNLKDLLAEYRLEVEVNKRDLENYRSQAVIITMELAKAQVRIGLLEDQLRDAKGERSRVTRELAELRQRRDELMAEREVMEEEANGMREHIRELEAKTGVTERIVRAPPAD